VGTGSACPEVLFDRAQARNLSAIQSGRVDLHRGFVESLPFDNDSFQKALAINSIQVWADPLVGLHEIRRVMKSEGMLALGFTPYSGQSIQGLIEILDAADFTNTRLVDEPSKGFCALGCKP
jgi:ubiquinone/menaquinone biosynthesis C-methylase UbiE